MKRMLPVVLSVLLIFGLAPLGSAYAQGDQTGKPQTGLFFHDGLSRSYVYYIPKSYQPGQPAPLLVVLHGGGGNGEQIMNGTGFNALAEQNGFIALYPDGLGGWNDEREIKSRINADDVGFLGALVDEFKALYSIDAGRVFFTGVSNGGMMSYYLACRMADQIAGIAAVVANMPALIVDGCKPSRPVPVLIIVGTADELVPFEGGTVAFNRGEVISAAATVEFWRGINGCSAKSTREDVPDTARDGVKATRLSFTDCTSGAPVIWYTLVGGKHTWPGRIALRRQAPSDVDATQVVWDFFAGLGKQGN